MILGRMCSSIGEGGLCCSARVLELVVDTGRPLTCESIASSQEIPFRFLKSASGDLRERSARSQRGCEGGYWLGRDAAEISLLEVASPSTAS